MAEINKVESDSEDFEKEKEKSDGLEGVYIFSKNYSPSPSFENNFFSRSFIKVGVYSLNWRKKYRNEWNKISFLCSIFIFPRSPDHEKSILKKIHLYRLENICTVYVQEKDVKVEITEVKGNF